MASAEDDGDAKDVKNDLARLRDALDGNSAAARKQACRRVLNLMRAGENVQALFSSVLRCVRTSDLELKKLAYLYLVSYSSHEPEQAIMAVNTFVQDAQDANPLVRALAARTMCRIRLESVAEHMVVPLKRCLRDADPYVRKTAAFGIAKLYDVIPEAVENAQLFAELLALLRDDNPMVVTNAVAAIGEINERRTAPIFALTAETIPPLISTLNASTDWCQAALLDALIRYVPETPEDASFFIDRLIPLLKNHNPAVIVAAFRGIFVFMGPSRRDPLELFPLVLPPFVTLVSNAAYELQYVVLRTLSLFIQKYPSALTREIRVFFCKYNDPAYIKMEKLDIIMSLCNLSNAQLVLNELNEYSNAVDVAFVQKSIRCIGQIAIRMEVGAPKCLDILVGLVNGRAEYAVTEAIIVFCDILRKYPGKFESVLINVVQNLDKIKEPRAKVAGLWILGEYCHIIEHVDLLLDPFLDTFHDEPPLVQLQVLSSLVKLFLDKPDATRDQLQFALTQATRDGTVPDVRNRALVYWRLLSLDQQTAKSVICFGKETLLDSGVRFDDAVLDELIRNMGSVAGVLHIVPADFVARVRFVPEEQLENDDGAIRVWSPVKLNDARFLDVYVAFDRINLYLKIVNKTAAPVGGLALAVRPNVIGLTPVGTPVFPETIESGDIAEITVPFRLAVAGAANLEDGQLQIALRTSVGNVFGLARIPLEIATVDAGQVSPDEFRASFASFTVNGAVTVADAEVASDAMLGERKVFVVGKNGNKTYVSFAFSGDAKYLAELAQNGTAFSVGIKGSSGVFLPAITQNAADFFGLK
jgi:vesicle coat complex subunit